MHGIYPRNPCARISVSRTGSRFVLSSLPTFSRDQGVSPRISPHNVSQVASNHHSPRRRMHPALHGPFLVPVPLRRTTGLTWRTQLPYRVLHTKEVLLACFRMSSLSPVVPTPQRGKGRTVESGDIYVSNISFQGTVGCRPPTRSTSERLSKLVTVS